MASTNKTTNYELSQYVSSDKPTYLVDYNSDMSKIDTAIHTAKTTADGAATAATNAATAAETAQGTANTAVTNAATAQSGVNSNATNIGVLANLTTVEKTSLVGAINELDSDIGSLISTSESQATNKAYSCDYVNTKLADKEDMPEVLYNNAVGTTGTVNITGHALEDYDYIEIYTELGTLHVFMPGISYETSISKTYYSDTLYHAYVRYAISSTISPTKSITISVAASGSYYSGANHAELFKIYKVVGHID